MSEKYYAGIGSRKTPQYIEESIKEITGILNKFGYILRSGGAPGADSMFEKYATCKEIFLPWKKFNSNESAFFLESIDPMIVEEAREIAKRYHPNWRGLSDAAKKLMTRNSFQLLGKDLKHPSEFIICWTEGGTINGGTGQALRIAKNRDIPVFNLYNEESLYKIKIHLSSKNRF